MRYRDHPGSAILWHELHIEVQRPRNREKIIYMQEHNQISMYLGISPHIMIWALI